MEKYKWLSLFLVLFVTSSCNEWLNVTPDDEIDERDLFATGNGYRHALNGVYFALGDRELYGQELSWGVVDALGQCYLYAMTGTSGTDAMQYGAKRYDWDHERMEPYIESMWKKVYNAVANCNNILNNIQSESPEKFDYGESEKSMIWGEALALRAFLQFDMLRLFAPAPITNPSNRTFIPYVSEYPVYVSIPQTVDSCLTCIIQDLEKAQELLWKADSGRTCSSLQFWESSYENDMSLFYKGKRGFRLNYYATTGLLARVYMYAQQKENAYDEAKSLIDISEETGWFELDYYPMEYQGNFKSYNDMLWGLESVDLLKFETAINELDRDDPKYLSVSGVSENFFGLDMDMDTQGNAICSDLRFQTWLTQTHDYYDTYRFSKYAQRDASKTSARIGNTLVPMIRISEMYYIAAEAIYETNLDEAKEYLITVKEGRGLYSSDHSVREVEAANVDNFMSLLINDARREWLGEGQIFYMYKRLNMNIPYVDEYGQASEISATEDHFVVPVPNVETDLM